MVLIVPARVGTAVYVCSYLNLTLKFRTFCSHNGSAVNWTIERRKARVCTAGFTVEVGGLYRVCVIYDR